MQGIEDKPRSVGFERNLDTSQPECTSLVTKDNDGTLIILGPLEKPLHVGNAVTVTPHASLWLVVSNLALLVPTLQTTQG